MILLVDGGSHTGKTNMSQYLLEKWKFPYFSIDHLKMGFIRSGEADFGVSDDEEIFRATWPIIVEMIKTMVENKQNMIIEGCYIPKNWKDYFEEEYIKHIGYVCLIFSSDYILNHYDRIIEHENVIEERVCSSISKEELFRDSKENLELCKAHKQFYILIDDSYDLILIERELREHLNISSSFKDKKEVEV